MRFLTALYLIATSFAMPIYSQSVISIIDIADDPNLNEIEPYLTYYWYSNYFDAIPEKPAVATSPLWLAYIETDAELKSRIVGYHFGFDVNHNIAISEKYAISGSATASVKHHPVIENFLGKPVAVWQEEIIGQTDLHYAFLDDDEWTAPERVNDDTAMESSPVFLTEDAYELNHQDYPENFLFWIADTAIIQASLDTDFRWNPPETIFSGPYSILRITARKTMDDEIWLLFDELHEPDSVYVRVLRLPADRSSWEAPRTVLKLRGTNSYAYLTGTPDPKKLCWIKDDTLRIASILRDDDTFDFLEIFDAYPYYPHSNLTCVSNQLPPGGCVIEPAPWCFLSSDVDDLPLLTLYGAPHNNLMIPVDTTANTVTALALSGLHRNHFMGAWGEWDGTQSDIRLFVGHIHIGVGVDETPTPPSSQLLLENHPNPFNAATLIAFDLPRGENVTLRIFDVGGRLIDEIPLGWKTRGHHTFTWDASNVPSGVYVIQLQTLRGCVRRKCTIMK